MVRSALAKFQQQTGATDQQANQFGQMMQGMYASGNLSPQQMAAFEQNTGADPRFAQFREATGATPNQTNDYAQFMNRLYKAGKLTPEQMAAFERNTGGTVMAQPVGNNTVVGEQYGLSGAEAGLRQGLGGALSALDTGVNRAETAIQGAQQPLMQAQNNLQPYQQGGQGANQLMAALSGAAGPEAQRAAFQNYQNSPGMDYALEQSERAIRRNAAATGGLGGGNVQRALSENAIGFAQQDFNNQFNRLNQTSNQGMQANQIGAGLAGQQSGLGATLANLYNQSGNVAANTMTNAGNNLANFRSQAGRDMANLTQGATNNMANLTNEQGINLSNLMGQAGTNMTNLFTGAGTANANQLSGLATLLSNLALQQGTGQANIDAALGRSNAAGIVDSAAGMRTGITDAISMAMGMPPMGNMMQGTGGNTFANTLPANVKPADINDLTVF